MVFRWTHLTEYCSERHKIKMKQSYSREAFALIWHFLCRRHPCLSDTLLPIAYTLVNLLRCFHFHFHEPHSQTWHEPTMHLPVNKLRPQQNNRYSHLSSYPGYFREPLWKSMGLWKYPGWLDRYGHFEDDIYKCICIQGCRAIWQYIIDFEFEFEFHHWCRQWLGTKLVPSHCLHNYDIVHGCIYIYQ